MSLYIQAAFIIGVFLFIRFLYMKYVEKEALPPSEFTKEGCICGISTVIGTLLFRSFYSALDGLNENTPPIFTGGPNF